MCVYARLCPQFVYDIQHWLWAAMTLHERVLVLPYVKGAVPMCTIESELLHRRVIQLAERGTVVADVRMLVMIRRVAMEHVPVEQVHGATVT